VKVIKAGTATHLDTTIGIKCWILVYNGEAKTKVK